MGYNEIYIPGVKKMKIKIQSKDGFKVVDLNRRNAAHEKCLNCCCWSPGQVANCTNTDCQLHWLSTGKGKQDPKKREKAIREHCRWCMNGQLSEVSKCTCRYCPLFAFRNSQLDRSVELPASKEKGHIQAPQEAYGNNPILSVGIQLSFDISTPI